ncbi:MAG TPA: [protein-PII] uridylyltransferase [Candidatus Limnocylindrales bacterium]|nr:[protein-PII] uridylyltransferase [Candidatus Limnocylindrales bacterium]
MTTGAPPGPSRSIILPAPGSVSGKLSDIARDYFEAVRDELETAHWAGASGTDTALRFAACLDNLIRFLFDAAIERYGRRYARTRQHCAVFALGGYGRREQCPQSDVDLLVLHSGSVTPFVETVTESLLYSLWDARLQVGHAVRNAQECVSLAAGDLTIKTALLDGRFLCGSPELAGEYESIVRKKLATSDVEVFVAAKIAETRGRHARHGGSVFILEPNVKEGQGGLRDLNHALWIARVKADASDLEALFDREIVTAREYEELVAAREFLFRTRAALHFHTKSKTEQLTFERQDAIGARFGYPAEGNNSVGDMYMRDYYHHAAVMWRTTDDIIDRLLSPPERTGLLERLVKQRALRPGVTVVGDRLQIEEKAIDGDPLNLIAVFADCQRFDLRLSSRSRELLRQKVDLITPEVAASKAAVDLFFDILRAKDGVYRTLAQMNRLGVLGKLIPEFGRLFCMVQHDYYHVYTVDEHSLIGIRELESLRQGELQQKSPFLTQTMRDCDRPELLFLAMMFHDVGKGYGGDHDERGAQMVREIAERLYMHEDDRDTLEFLVRNHLLMSMLAQTRDIDDPNLVLDFVRDVGTAENLTLLYLLTFADMRAVGPVIWTSWKDHLLAELYRRAVEVFETGVVSEADMESRAERTRLRLLARTAGTSEHARLQDFLAALPTSYFLGNPDEKIIDHWRLYESVGKSIFRHGVEHFPERGFTEFTICARDRIGLFRDMVGALSSHGLNILSVRLVTTSTGWALDVFRIEHNEAEVDVASVDVWAGVAATLERIFAGEVDASSIVREVLLSRTRRIGDRSAARRSATRVEIDNRLSREFTVIDVYASDRPGLLFLVADAIFRLGLDIHLAKISTHLTAVLDVFYVTDSNRSKIEDSVRLDEIRAAIADALDRDDVPAPVPAASAVAVRVF